MSSFHVPQLHVSKSEISKENPFVNCIVMTNNENIYKPNINMSKIIRNWIKNPRSHLNRIEQRDVSPNIKKTLHANVINFGLQKEINIYIGSQNVEKLEQKRVQYTSDEEKIVKSKTNLNNNNSLFGILRWICYSFVYFRTENTGQTD